MASKKVSVLKFVGTVSLGLFTGTSYSLSTLTIPSLLEFPSASAAARALQSIVTTASRRLGALSVLSGSTFLLAFALSPSGFRHPYLLYTSLFCFGAPLTDFVTPFIFGAPPTSSSSSSRRGLSQARKGKKEKAAAAAARRMEASYEVLGSETSHGGSDFDGEGGGGITTTSTTTETRFNASSSSTSDDLFDESEEGEDEKAAAAYNGEQVRAEVEYFVRNQAIQTFVAGVGFAMAVLGIWGDGAHRVADTLVVEL
ncbi:hypothetical protein F5Y17DRAFT_429719 [Xylariaceae sp. FL0594]|nr:hypothetical protein F5Y17DRAFT_429719 [Xylariaceae sp. FL0594]